MPTRIALAAVVLVGALAIVLLAWNRGGGGEATRTAAPPIDARTDISPRSVLFGDTVNAVVEVTLDRNRVDPDSVRPSGQLRALEATREPAANPP